MTRSLILLVPFVLLAACSDYGIVPAGAYEKAGEDPVDTAGPIDSADPPQDTAEPPEDTSDPTVDETGDPPDTGEPDEPADPSAGCADGEREGFLSWDAYPEIAACSGAWSVGGVTRDDLVTTCGQAAGDDGTNVEGSGCSAADVCAAGWHVCDGHAEVEDKAGSCGDAVPAGTPDKSLFFAVSQHSISNSQCDDAAEEGNDVFGCGNLGIELQSDKDCGVLTRVLASMHPDSCGFNEAEPPLGPWECAGDDNSHYAEGTLVTKSGCPGWSCSYDGYAVGSADKGGVICCAD